MSMGSPKPFHYAPPMEPWLSVVHRDEDVLVLAKPSGLLHVPGKPVEHADCLEARAQGAFPTAMTVHRLDKDTSGVVVMGMNRKAHAHLSQQFETRQTRKIYIARVWGRISGESGRIDLPIACDWPNRPKQMVDPENGRPAQTDWAVVERDATSTRVELRPATGRSHQLRVHMLSLGHPILGDNFYAHEEAFTAADRLQLHAESLSFFHPSTGEACLFTVACPF
ncbi:pseudouridine synthase [Parvibaculum sp.]|uniref:pseudouridine synthase n=1 Tax=Parvibaculum sp. TaxID=2024848 RepID=UPI002CC190EE|nr:pseudouridine synthase [Parvibaculum sp.]HUD52841.1 pseudouridine synthase [Parvibaculum sp.]